MGWGKEKMNLADTIKGFIVKDKKNFSVIGSCKAKDLRKEDELCT